MSVGGVLFSEEYVFTGCAAVECRIMVPSEYVGAIIGRKGQTIRNITTRCKARYCQKM